MKGLKDGYIIGAGCSYSLTSGKIPLGIKLAEELVVDPVIAKLFSKFEPNNKIDVLLTQIDVRNNQVNVTDNEKKSLVESRKYLETRIKEIISKHDFPTEHSLRFAKILRPNSSVCTFNYDLLVERSLWKTKQWSPKAGYGGIDKDYLPFDHVPGNTNGIKIFKLHGSFNFKVYKVHMSEDRFIAPVISDYYFPGINLAYSHINEEVDDSLVYPSYFKSYAIPSGRNIWNKAFEEIRTCDRLFIVGYSFPPEDPLSVFLLDAFWSDVTSHLIEAASVPRNRGRFSESILL